LNLSVNAHLGDAFEISRSELVPYVDAKMTERFAASVWQRVQESLRSDRFHEIQLELERRNTLTTRDRLAALDLKDLLDLMIRQWETVFITGSRRLRREERNHVHGLLDARNRRAHQNSYNTFTQDKADRVIGNALELLEAIQASEEAQNRHRGVKAGLRPSPNDSIDQSLGPDPSSGRSRSVLIDPVQRQRSHRGSVERTSGSRCCPGPHPFDSCPQRAELWPHRVRCLIIGENPGGENSAYFYDPPEMGRVPVRDRLLEGLLNEGLIEAASLRAFASAGFAFDHAIRCRLDGQIAHERSRAMRFASERAHRAEHLRGALDAHPSLWLMGI
jgi:hypothetical protein